MQTVAPQTWYVYTHAYPGGTIFYVGKGTKGRIDHHERATQGTCSCEKCRVIRQIWAGGQPIQKRIVFETLVYERDQKAPPQSCFLTSGSIERPCGRLCP